MNKRGEVSNNSLLVIILLAMILLIGFAFLTPVASVTNRVSEKQVNLNETQNLGSCVTVVGAIQAINESDADCNITVDGWYPTGDWRRNDSQCYLSSVAVRNGTGTALTVNTAYTVFASTGIVKMENTTSTQNLTGNNTYLTYSTCDAGYFKDSGSRSLSKLWTTMMVLVLLITAAAVAYKEMNK